MMTCTEKGCEDPATHYPCINLPKVGVPIDLHLPLQLILCLPLCRKHAGGYPIKGALPNKAKKQISRASYAQGMPAPDYDRAFISAEDMNSRRSQMFNIVGGLNESRNAIKN